MMWFGLQVLFGFLYGLFGNPDVITIEDLQDPQLKADTQDLLSGVERSSGSSEWLKTMFLDGDYDGLSISDSPIGYIDNGGNEKEEAFLESQEFLLSDEIQKTGRRTDFEGVKEENKYIFNEDWGVDTDRILSPITMPAGEVIIEALNLYQIEFRKPYLTLYLLDFSGSMAGEGEDQLKEAMSQILLQENAEKNFLQASINEVNIIIPFSDEILADYKAGGSPDEMESLYHDVEDTDANGGTDMYNAMMYGLDSITEYNLKDYNTAMILMTDGESMTSNKRVFFDYYEKTGNGIPIFSIMFGNADDEQLNEIASLTNARVFDGRTDLIDAFRRVGSETFE